jgi:hypothetical protein
MCRKIWCDIVALFGFTFRELNMLLFSSQKYMIWLGSRLLEARSVFFLPTRVSVTLACVRSAQPLQKVECSTRCSAAWRIACMLVLRLSKIFNTGKLRLLASHLFLWLQPRSLQLISYIIVFFSYARLWLWKCNSEQVSLWFWISL